MLDWKMWRRSSLAKSVMCILANYVLFRSVIGCNCLLFYVVFLSCKFSSSPPYASQHCPTHRSGSDAPCSLIYLSLISGAVSCSFSYTPPPKGAQGGSTCEDPVVGAMNEVRYILR